MSNAPSAACPGREPRSDAHGAAQPAIDEIAQECLAIKVARRLNGMDVIEMPPALCLGHGGPAYIRSDQGPDFIVGVVRWWLAFARVAKPS